MKNQKFIVALFILASTIVHSQEMNNKKPLDFTVYDSWNNIDRPMASNDGNWVSYEINPYKGDGEIVVMNPFNIEKRVFHRGTKAVFSPTSKFIAFKIVPQVDSLRKQKLNKEKKENLVKDSLLVWVFNDDRLIVVPNLSSFKVPEEKSDWMAYLYENKEEKTDSTKKAVNGNSSKKNWKKNKNAPDLFDLVVVNPITKNEFRFTDVSEFNFSKNGKLLGFVQINCDSVFCSKVSFFDTQKMGNVKIFEKTGLAKNIVVDNLGNQGAFLFSTDTTKTKAYSLNFWSTGTLNSTEISLVNNSVDVPKNWTASENGTIWFSKDDLKLYFGLAPKPEIEKKDTLLDEEKIKLDIWTWNEPVLQSQQLAELKKEEKRTYLSVFHIKERQVVRLANESISEMQTILFGNSNVALGISNETYKIESSWQYPTPEDYYLVDVKSGKKILLLKGSTAEVNISPSGNYLFWFEKAEKAWYAMNLKNMVKKNLTSSLKVNFYDEEFDLPTEVNSYGFAGWSKNDTHFFVYDRYDIWKIDPKGIEAPVMLTKGYGRKNNIRFTYEALNKDITYINTDEKILLFAFNRQNKQSGYFKANALQISEPSKIVMDNFNFYTPIKAKDAPIYLWQKSTVSEFPNLWYGDEKMVDPMQISNANPQQQNYIWATAELHKWTTFDGKDEEGLLYKPENFDPFKKYPMIIYFYDVASDNLYNHITPKPSRSVISAIDYASNGYIVFIPNIRYQIGNPGKSAYNYVVSGAQSLINLGFVDENKIGIQGQSWGGYQVAYLITQTNMFKAASAGAPVSNMTSAYGGIRWETGMSRMYQYEKTQSRIGATLWENPELYIKNSPLFYADKIETPLLIRANDADGAVPWEQGIELFVALRRLSKPVWLLNYNGEAHNLKDKSPNCKDLSIRMMQFYNHYLKNEPAPEWLTKGIPAIKKGKNFGYELNK